VISLAGIAFAVGMVVDAAIVVLENIYRLRQQGTAARRRLSKAPRRSGARSWSRR
jgi:HAE1 family hydrophobic/amphiphilic exporter-1